MLQDKRRLMLLEVKEINFKDSESGEPVKKYRYDFLNADGQPITAYADVKKYTDRVVNAAGYIDSKANDYDFVGRIWDGIIKWQLV